MLGLKIYECGDCGHPTEDTEPLAFCPDCGSENVYDITDDLLAYNAQNSTTAAQ